MILREPRPTSPSTHAPHRGAFYDAAAAARLAAGAERARCEPRRRFDRTRGGRRSYVARTQPRWGRLPVRGRTGGATGAARSGLRPVPAHRPGAAAVPQREPRGKRPRCLQAVGGADRPLQGGPFGAWGGPRRGPLRGVRPPVCSGSLIPEVKNNDSAIAKPFPLLISRPCYKISQTRKLIGLKQHIKFIMKCSVNVFRYKIEFSVYLTSIWISTSSYILKSCDRLFLPL